MDKMMDDDYILNFEDKHQNEPGCNINGILLLRHLCCIHNKDKYDMFSFCSYYLALPFPCRTLAQCLHILPSVSTHFCTVMTFTSIRHLAGKYFT
jgi:hypothetical protein